MRAFLIAFICLSTLAVAQNVVVATPVVSHASEPGVGARLAPDADAPGSRGVMMTADSGDAARSFVSAMPAQGGGVSRATTMLLFVVGLSGLCAVGGRRHDRRQRQSV